MSDSSMSSVERLCIDTIEMPHSSRQRWIDRFDEQMIVVWQRDALLEVNCVHLFETAVGVTEPVEAIYDLLNDLQEPTTIFIIEIDGLLSISTTSHVVDSA